MLHSCEFFLATEFIMITVQFVDFPALLLAFSIVLQRHLDNDHRQRGDRVWTLSGDRIWTLSAVCASREKEKWKWGGRQVDISAHVSREEVRDSACHVARVFLGKLGSVHYSVHFLLLAVRAELTLTTERTWDGRLQSRVQMLRVAPCAVKSSFKTGLQISLKRSIIYCRLSFDKISISRFKSEITYFCVWTLNMNRLCLQVVCICKSHRGQHTSSELNLFFPLNQLWIRFKVPICYTHTL